MKKVLITIDNNSLIFKERKKLNTEYKNLLNTNVISCNELLFSDEYLLTNTKIVSTFIYELTNNYSIDTIVIENYDLLLMVLDVIKNNKNINNLVIKEDVPITFDACEKIIKTYINSINCYTLQTFMIEYLDRYGVIVETRNELLFLSKFMIQNDLNEFSSIFYKMTLQVKFPMSIQDEEDFLAFATINKYIKTIHVNTVCKSDLEYIVSILRKTNKKNIRIVIHDNINDIEVINYLKDYNRKKSKKYKIYFKLAYSNEYLKENLIKQANSSILAICGFIILIIIVSSFGYVFYDNYISMKKVSDIKNDIANIIIESQKKEEEENNTTTPIEEPNTNNESNNDVIKEKTIVNKDIKSLFDANPDTVGWLTVKNTNIDYPVLQTVNNDYYLKHNFNMEKDNNGWVFMDYRNNGDDVNDNTIIYAHNRYYSGVMFGTLQNMFRKNWYTNPENQIITFKTMYETYEYKIFSFYRILTTSDYIRTIFTYSEKKEFYDMLKNRSNYDFGIELTNDDHILTLSTCADETSRYVVHAVLVKRS